MLPGTWRAWYIGSPTQLIVVKNIAYDKAVSAVDAPFVQPTVLRRYLTFKYPDFMQFGEQGALEMAIDEACNLYKRTPDKIPTRTIEEVAREFLGEFGADAMLKHPDKNTPYFVGAALSTLVKPDKMARSSSPAKFTVVSAVASCKETPGKRYHFAQKRAFNTNVSNNVRALTWLIEKWIVAHVEAAKDEEAKKAMEGRSIGVSIKAIRLTLTKMREYQSWLTSPEGKLLGGGVIWDAPLVPMAQA
ncbi:MAG: hypothetical protein HY074_18145, partial [Deltaproteobacteria bacterium]|nr:hypothetical protein [Deltaproteobacteria bacterium]